MTRAGIKQLLKFGVSLLLLFFTLRLIDWRESLELAGRANSGMMAVAVGLLFAERILSTNKWLLLLRAKCSRITFWRLLVINFIGGFWGLVLPSSVAADIVRGYYLAKSTANVSLAVTSMLVDRFMGALSLVLLGCASAWMVGDTFGLVNARLISAGVAAACALGIALMFHDGFIGWVDRQIIRHVARLKVIRPVRGWLASCFEYRQYPNTLVASFLLTIFVQILRILVFYAVALSFGIRVPVMYYFIFVPLITALIMLPVSVNGIGVREGSFVAFFALVGVPTSEAFIISFAVSVLTTLMTAAGGIFYMFDKCAIKPMAVNPEQPKC
ncbi:MAG: lysylphosphatidylglycerol synthase transmembrane domain-containing protein [Kiritimatiellae bacterium]|nr:lysylphosphatidylglycerol synthase transmembrane domain-containing protein [Kiritimatiellia bacterium]